MSIIITSLLIGGLGLLVVGIMVARLQPSRLRIRLAELTNRPASLEELELNQPFSERVWRPLLQRLARLGERFIGRKGSADGESSVEKMRRRLEQAGSPHRWTPADWLGIKLLCGLCGAGITLALFWSAPLPTRLLMATGGAVAGYFLPEFWLKRQINQRQKAIRRALPDVLDLLVVSVQAGLGFDAAIAHVAAQMDNPLTEELSRMLAEMRVGRARREALRELIARTNVPELAQFAGALIQAEQLGVSVVQVLVAQSQLMRVQRRQRIQEQAQKAPLKMVVPLGMFIFPALCVVILGPIWPTLVAAFRR
jgi:tight adherence protein C